MISRDCVQKINIITTNNPFIVFIRVFKYKSIVTITFNLFQLMNEIDLFHFEIHCVLITRKNKKGKTEQYYCNN